MAIRRSKRDSNFTMISNVGLKDKRLSFKAKGLLSYMLSLPDDWVFYESEIVNHATDGKQSVRTGMKELEKFGYLVREQQRSSNGKFANIDWVVSDEPINSVTTASQPSTDLPSSDNPSSDNPSSDNRTLLSTKELSTKELSTNNKENTSAKLTEDFEKLWNLYPNKQGKKKAKSSYERAIKNGTTNKEIQDGIVRYKNHLKQNDWLKPAHGATWFNNERWEDEYTIESQTKPSGNNFIEDLWED